MWITNHTLFSIIAFGVDMKRGYGDEVHIGPGGRAEVFGPCSGEMDGRKRYVRIVGHVVVCQETTDHECGLLVRRGSPLHIQSGQKGVIVRHYLDQPDPRVVEWRLAHSSD